MLYNNHKCLKFMCQMPFGRTASGRTGSTGPLAAWSRPPPLIHSIWSLVSGPRTVPTDRLNAWKLFMTVSYVHVYVCVCVWVCGVFEFNWFLMCMQTHREWVREGAGDRGWGQIARLVGGTQCKINNHMGHYFGVAVCISQFAAVYGCIHLAWLGATV